MNAINICLNAVFIYGLNWGVFGAVFATLIARSIACVIVLRSLTHRENEIHVNDYLHWHFDPRYIKKILTIGIPSGLENGMFQLGKLLVQSLIATFGTYAIAANAVSNNLCQMQIIPGTALSLAMVTVVGRCIGAQDYDQAKYYIKKLMLIAYGSTIVLVIFLLLATPTILGFYSLSKQATDLAYQCIFMHGIIASIFWPASFTFPNALRAANDAKYTMIVSAASMWTFRFCLSYVLGRYMQMGLIGVWIAMFVDWIVRVVFFMIRYKSNKWMEKGLV